MVRFSFMTQTAIVFLWRSTPMKFIAGLLVWGNGGMGKTSQVFPRFKGSANRRVDLHLPLIVSIPCPRRGAMATLADRRRRAEKTAQQWERRRPRSSPVDLSNSRQPHHILTLLELTAPRW